MKHKLEGRAECPSCGCKIDGAGNVGYDVDAPRPGDYAACIYCVTPLVYLGPEHGYRRMTLVDIEEMGNDQAQLLLAALRRLSVMRAQRG